MPKIVTPEPVDGAAITTTNGAHHFRFTGIEFTCTHATTTSALTEIINIYYGNYGEKPVFYDPPHDIIFDRCYIHGTPSGSLKRGIILNGAYLAVIDSYISECHDVLDGAQAILSYLGPGPIKISNNHLESSGENIFFGGVMSLGPTTNPSDIEITHNHICKPLTWNPRHKSFTGMHWILRELFKISNAQRVLVDGNVFENIWLDAFSRFAITIKLEDEFETNWHICEDIIFTNNIVRNSPSGISLIGYCAVGNEVPHNWAQRLLVKNNLMYNLGGPEWGGMGLLFSIMNNFSGLIIEHNTFYDAASIILCDGLPNYEFSYKNNIKVADYHFYGVKSASSGDGTDTLNYYFPGFEFEGNIIAKGKPSNFPVNNSFPNNTEEIGFIDYKKGDYRLAKTSKYKNAGTDGIDPGADIDAVMGATDGVSPLSPLSLLGGEQKDVEVI